MKILIPFLATVFLATMTFAQEESASPAAEATAPATDEKASATVEETPAAKAAESTAPAAETKAEAAASPKAAASMTEKTEKKEATAAAASTTTTTKAASATAAAPMNTKGMGPKELENTWEAAVASHNFATIESLVAADFVGVSSKGKFVGRSQLLSETKGDKDTYKTAKNEKLNVKMFGPNVAVVTGRVREVGSGKDGKAFDRAFLFTDTWMMRGGKWQCIASQVSKIKG